MTFAEALGIGPGVTALIGGGGKTSLMLTLAKELSSKGSIIICTTTLLGICRFFWVRIKIWYQRR